MGVVLGVDGGNTKTELLAATLAGEPVAFVRGPGSNSHAVGVEGAVDVIAGLLEEAAVEIPAEAGAFFLCGADVPSDIADLEAAIVPRGFASRVLVDNDTFAVLLAGTTGSDAVAVVCGAGINCVGRRADGRVARYPSLGWETGDWGGGDSLGREALFLATRAEDGRGEPTALVEAVRTHFGLPGAQAVGEAVHYGRIAQTRLGELAPAIVTAAEAGDGVAQGLVRRLAREIALMVQRAFRDLELASAEVVLGGGLLRPGAGALHDAVLDALPAGAHPLVLTSPPALGAAVAALRAAGAGPGSERRLRDAVKELTPAAR